MDPYGVKPWVYIASPYTLGDQGMNVGTQHRWMNTLLDSQLVVPYAPLLTHYQHIQYPRNYDAWLNYCREICRRCDACLRVPSRYDNLFYHQEESRGAEIEAAYFRAHNLPVFTEHDLVPLYDWARKWTAEKLGQPIPETKELPLFEAAAE